MKTLKIGIACYKDMLKPGDPKVWFTSTESFAKVLSHKNAPCSRRSRRRIRYRFRNWRGTPAARHPICPGR